MEATKNQDVRLMVWTSKENDDGLERMARETGRTKRHIVNSALEKYIAEYNRGRDNNADKT